MSFAPHCLKYSTCVIAHVMFPFSLSLFILPSICGISILSSIIALARPLFFSFLFKPWNLLTSHLVHLQPACRKLELESGGFICILFQTSALNLHISLFWPSEENYLQLTGCQVAVGVLLHPGPQVELISSLCSTVRGRRCCTWKPQWTTGNTKVRP